MSEILRKAPSPRFTITVSDAAGNTLTWKEGKLLGDRSLVKIVWCASISRHRVLLRGQGKETVTASLHAPYDAKSIAAALLSAFNGEAEVICSPAGALNGIYSKPDNDFYSKQVVERNTKSRSTTNALTGNLIVFHPRKTA